MKLVQQRLITGIAWMFAGNWAEQIFGFLVFIVLARLLGAEGFGLAMMAIAFVVLGECLVRESLTEALIQRREVDDGHLDSLFWSLLLVSGGFVALLFLLAPAIARFFSQPELTDYLRVASFTILFVGLSGVPVAQLRRRLEFRVLAMRATVGVVLGGIVGVAMAFMDYGPWSLIGQRLVQIFVTEGLAWIANPWLPRFRAKQKHFTDLWEFGSRMLGLRLGELVSTQSPVVVIGYVLGPAALGQFMVAWRLVDVLANALVSPIRYVAQPAFTHLQSHNVAGQTLREVTEISAFVAFAFFVGVGLVAYPLVPVFFGPGWDLAIPVLIVLSVLGIYLSIERLQQAYCLGRGFVGGLYKLSGAEAVLGIVLMVCAAPYGLTAVGIAFVGRYLILWPIRFVIVKRISGTNIVGFLKCLLAPMFASLAMAICVLLWKFLVGDKLADSVLLISSAGIGAFAFSGFAWFVMRAHVLRLMSFFKSMSDKTELDGTLPGGASVP